MKWLKLLGYPVVGLLAVVHAEAGAQALPATELETLVASVGEPAAPSAAATKGATFQQLSAPTAVVAQASSAPAPHAAAAATAGSEPESESRWLPLAGLAALLFIGRRHQRQTHGASTHPGSGTPARPGRLAEL